MSALAPVSKFRQQPPTYDLLDDRGSGVGWSVTLQSSASAVGTTTLGTSLTLAALSWGCDSNSSCAVPANTGGGAVGYPLTIPLGGSAVKML